AIWNTPGVDKTSEQWKAFQVYSGRFWFSNGMYHHYSNDKFVPECSFEYFSQLVKSADPEAVPLMDNETVDAFLSRMQPIIFDPQFERKMVNLTEGIDHVAKSSNNFYEGVTQEEVEAFYAKFPHTGQDPEWGLNSKVIKEDGQVKEKVWKSGGMYGAAI